MIQIAISDGSGVFERHWLDSRYVPARNVDVWLPPGYARLPQARFPVLYMHDGQNLFDASLVGSGADWGMDEAVTRLVESGRSRGAIVAGVWNSGDRWREYMPQLAWEADPDPENRAIYSAKSGGAPLAENYLRFLVEEVKPIIDHAYRTLAGQPHTCVMGSSMGGLCSLYALVRYPQVFGGAGCLSTHWSAGRNPLVDWLGQALPRAGRHRLYFDYGSLGLDAEYAPFQQRMDGHLRAAGYTQGLDWITRSFEGEEHSEHAWRKRVEGAVGFLLAVSR